MTRPLGPLGAKTAMRVMFRDAFSAGPPRRRRLL